MERMEQELSRCCRRAMVLETTDWNSAGSLLAVYLNLNASSAHSPRVSPHCVACAYSRLSALPGHSSPYAIHFCLRTHEQAHVDNF